jgi:hypothetical protein
LCFLFAIDVVQAGGVVHGAPMRRPAASVWLTRGY